VLPWFDQTGLNGITLELPGKTDTIATTGQEMRPADAAAKVTPPIARLRSSLLGEIFFETADVGDGLDLGGGAEPRSAQRICDVAIAEEYDMGMQQRPGLENPRAVCREALSRLLTCDPLLVSGNRVPGRPLGCGQPAQLPLRPGRPLHLVTRSIETP
jgi:hypothetical protein